MVERNAARSLAWPVNTLGAAFILQAPTPRSTSQPTKQLFLRCILQGAIDFAALRERRWRRGRLCT